MLPFIYFPDSALGNVFYREKTPQKNRSTLILHSAVWRFRTRTTEALFSRADLEFLKGCLFYFPNSADAS